MQGHPHTDPQYDLELNVFHDQLLALGGLVESQINYAVRAIESRDDSVARHAMSRDGDVSQQESALSERSVRLLALRQPTARDLRLVVTGLKVASALGRIGSMARRICERALDLNREPALLPLIDIVGMADVVQHMLRQSLDAFVREDADLALEATASRQEIDGLQRQLFRILLSYVAEKPETVPRVVDLLFISECMERIAEHATSMAEMIAYWLTGTRPEHVDLVPDPALVGH